MIKKIILSLLIIIILLIANLLVMYKPFQTSDNREEETSANPRKTMAIMNVPLEAPADNVLKYTEITNFDKPIVVMFYVDWCTFCRKFMPIFGDIARKYEKEYTFALVHCEKPENKKLVEESFITGFPTVRIIDKKYNYSATVNIYAPDQMEVIQQELDNYINLRKRIK